MGCLEAQPLSHFESKPPGMRASNSVDVFSSRVCSSKPSFTMPLRYSFLLCSPHCSAPFTTGLNLSALNIQADRRGFIPVTDKMEVGVRRCLDGARPCWLTCACTVLALACAYVRYSRLLCLDARKMLSH